MFRGILQLVLSWFRPSRTTHHRTDRRVGEFDVFLSYNSKDWSFVQRVGQALKDRRIKVWLDKEQLVPGCRWQDSLEEIIRVTRSVAVLVGKDGLGPWEETEVRAFLSQFVERRLPVIPVLLPGAYPRPELPLFLQQFVWVDLTDGLTKEGLDRLVWGISGVQPNLGGPADRAAKSPECQRARLTGVPDLPKYFLPRRATFEHLRRQLLVESDNVTGLAIHGMGGLGKTVLATALARDDSIRARFVDGVHWLNLGSESEVCLLQSKLMRSLGSHRQFDDASLGKEHLRDLFSTTSSLLILDDAWRPDDVRAFDVLGKESRLLVTTREGNIATALGAEEFCLSVLTDVESRHLLANWAGAGPDNLPYEASQVARECGNLPLALAVCGAMAAEGVPWHDLLDALREADLGFLKPGPQIIDYSHESVHKALKVSVDFFARQDAKGPERYLELAVYPKDEPIPAASVLTLWKHTGGLNEREARRLLYTLQRKALLTIKGGDKENVTVTLHDLHHDFIRMKYESE